MPVASDSGEGTVAVSTRHVLVNQPEATVAVGVGSQLDIEPTLGRMPRVSPEVINVPLR